MHYVLNMMIYSMCNPVLYICQPIHYMHLQSDRIQKINELKWEKWVHIAYPSYFPYVSNDCISSVICGDNNVSHLRKLISWNAPSDTFFWRLLFLFFFLNKCFYSLSPHSACLWPSCIVFFFFFLLSSNQHYEMICSLSLAVIRGRTLPIKICFMPNHNGATCFLFWHVEEMWLVIFSMFLQIHIQLMQIFSVLK